MITFTPLAGAVGAQSPVPLAYLLHVDDIRVLLDCGSPDWSPEQPAPADAYCAALRECACSLPSRSRLTLFHRCASTVDLVLLSHGDLAHAGLYAYAYARWGLKAPAYTTIPVQAMARIVTLEDIEATRDEQDVPDDESPDPQVPPSKKCIATVNQVHEAYDAVNTLRYSQPTHLQG